MKAHEAPRLLVDIGAHYARFALETHHGRLSHSMALICADHDGPESIIRAYLATLPSTVVVRHAAMALANPVKGDAIQMTNYPWHFSIDATRRALGFETLVAVNDFTALAMALPHLPQSHFHAIGGGEPNPHSVIGVLGAGTGLGVSGLIPAGDRYISLGSEGGHNSFAPVDATEVKVLQYAWKHWPHVSFERLLSASGLALMHQALHPGVDPNCSAPEISARALAGDARCCSTLDLFCRILGTAASNVALTLGATGGIYIGGTIVPRLGAFLESSGFRARFEDKGRFSDYLRQIPTWVIQDENAGLLGLSAILDEEIRSLKQSDSGFLVQIQRIREQLSPAEQRVADLVLAQPHSFLKEPIQAIAEAAEVSQPTVIRFCRSAGLKGLSDFKLRLASGLTASVPVMHSQVTQLDSSLELGAKVLGNTANAVLQLRSALQREEINAALSLLAAAERIELFACGIDAALAHDAQIKFLHLGMACNVHVDARLHPLVAATLDPATVAIFIGNDDPACDRSTTLASLSERGVKSIVIQTESSNKRPNADAHLIVQHIGHDETRIPMVSRVLQQLMIDILVVGLEVQHNPGDTGASPAGYVRQGVRLSGHLEP